MADAHHRQKFLKNPFLGHNGKFKNSQVECCKIKTQWLTHKKNIFTVGNFKIAKK